jgi:carnitine O-acetyltransferase
MTQNYEHLASLSPTNAAHLKVIHQCLFNVALDAHTHTLGSSSPPSSSSSTYTLDLDTPAEIDAHLHNIRSGPNARNRWFDKAVTLIVESNSRAGVMGEHSPVDALAPSMISEYAFIEPLPPHLVDELPTGWEYVAAEADVEDGGWRQLRWTTDAALEQACVEAQQRAEEVIADSDNSVLWFSEYGADWIKDVGTSVWPADAPVASC